MIFLKRVINKIKIIPGLSQLGASSYFKVKFFFFAFWWPLRKRLGIRGETKTKICLKKFDREFNFYFTDTIEFAVFNEIFLDREYDFDLKREPLVIFDLGSNVGVSVIYFKLKYPEAKIYAFEPDPITFQKLKTNTEQFNDVFVFNLAISDQNGRGRFFIYPNSNLSSSSIERVPNQKYIEVETRTLDSLMDELKLDGIDLIKFDIEGAESKVFANFKNIVNVNNLVGEVHLDLIGDSKEEFLKKFKNFSIEIVDSGPQRLILKAKKNV